MPKAATTTGELTTIPLVDTAALPKRINEKVAWVSLSHRS